MWNSIESSITRRRLLRYGMLAGVGAAVAQSLRAVNSPAAATPPSCMPCNPSRPSNPSDALQALIDGNARWASEKQEHPGEGKKTRICNANPDCKQTPFAALLSCVDSRVPPELLFDQGIGDLFVARVAGNSVVEILEDSLKYGTANLHALVLFVLGHTQCGAVMAAVDSYLSNPSNPTPTFAFEVPIYPAVPVAQEILKQQGLDPTNPKLLVPVTIDQHVIMTVQYLASTDPFQILVKNNELLIKGGRYDLASQKVVILV